MDPLERQTIAKVSARLVPFLVVCYFVAYLDRVNVGFAALTMNNDLNLTASAYGFAAGVFFLAYFFFEIPSNLFLERVGARKWIARIMFTWGLISGGTAFVQGETSFFIVRVLLGIAEAGFFPGIIFYLTLWFPAVYRARIIGYFMAAIPLSTVIGAPISGLLLGLDGYMGMKGWQWLFILEAMPALVLSVVVFFYLTDRPSDATWLQPDERAWLVRRLEAEHAQRTTRHNLSVGQALLNPKVLALSVVYFGAVATNYGLSFFLPQIVKAFGLTNVQTGLVSAIPYAVGLVSIVWWGHRSDRKRGTAVPRRVPAGGGVRRHRALDALRQSGAEDARALHRGLRHLRQPAGILDAANGVPVGGRGGRRDRADQLDRQPRRLRRSICHGGDQGLDRQLHRRAAVPVGARARGDGDGSTAGPRLVVGARARNRPSC